MTPQKILRISPITTTGETPAAAPDRIEFPPSLMVDEVSNPVEALSKLSRYNYSGVFLDGGEGANEDGFVRLLQSERILDGMPDGVALINSEMIVTWANSRLRMWSPLESPGGHNFYAILGNPQIMGPDFCPFHTALATGMSSSSTLQTDDNRYYQVHVAPLTDAATDNAALVATVSDITSEILQQQKLAAIHQAGLQLTDLKPDEIFAMDTSARIELLKDNIRYYTADLLNVEVIEIRLLEQSTGNLMPLLSVGINQEAADRKLYARPQGNGVTGYVASTGKSYLCEDARQDPLYLQAFAGAASSLTVPLILHDTIIGTINVESNVVCAFDSTDLQFLEIFSRDVAVALNTLELLVAQKNNAAQQSCEAIHSAVALPVDHILNDAVSVIEKYIGQDPEVVDRLQRILQEARDIRRVIQQIGQKMAPAEALPAGCTEQLHHKLRGKRILVVDSDLQVLNDAHMLLERFGCIVEAAHSGDEAGSMYRNSRLDAAYDVVISAVNLPDYSGYQLMLRLLQITERVPMALMTGFGYDPGHSIVKARQAGLHPKALLYKPFKLAQLLGVVEIVLDGPQPTRDPL
ncbi:hybrid sensor histidine kinase/response regulator [Aureliella helgolandensis]|uniref:Response regulator FixJ n=1 Tax=Aureliella helgolandensis TaxID=2527968 RepID=A0A518G624_9BACT|nr:GAF domain-containing protein [Aureliella helgolandensis]QDV24046.1 response regulator FixJ [Aureliella helgolandensis]